MLNFDVGRGPLDVTGTRLADDIDGSRRADRIDGARGQDVIDGGAGEDLLSGGAGADVLYGGTQDDSISGGTGADLLLGGEGDDVLLGDDSLMQTSARAKSNEAGDATYAISMTAPDSSDNGKISIEGFVSDDRIVSGAFNIPVMIDDSVSTDAIAPELSLGDVNDDGIADTVLDAEIVAVRELRDSIVEDAGALDARVALIPFHGMASIASMGRIDADSDGDGLRDADAAALALEPYQSGFFDWGLKRAINFFDSRPDGQENIVYFMSHEEASGGDFQGLAETLRERSGIDATVRAFALQTDAAEADLDLADDGEANDSPVVVNDMTQLSEMMLASPVSASEIKRVDFLLNGEKVASLAADELKETPFGLKYEIDISGLTLEGDDRLVARLVTNDPTARRVKTAQVIEAEAGKPGEDILTGGEGDDVLYGNGRRDMLSGGLGEDRLHGGGGGDKLTGGAGADLLEGGLHRDVLRGGGGRDVLDGGRGDDRLFGGGGRDTFLFEGRNHGRDRIIDFNVGRDKIDLTYHAVADFEALDIIERGGDALIRIDGGVIRIIDVAPDMLDAGDFLL